MNEKSRPTWAAATICSTRDWNWTSKRNELRKVTDRNCSWSNYCYCPTASPQTAVWRGSSMQPLKPILIVWFREPDLLFYRAKRETRHSGTFWNLSTKPKVRPNKETRGFIFQISVEIAFVSFVPVGTTSKQFFVSCFSIRNQNSSLIWSFPSLTKSKDQINARWYVQLLYSLLNDSKITWLFYRRTAQLSVGISLE